MKTKAKTMTNTKREGAAANGGRTRKRFMQTVERLDADGRRLLLVSMDAAVSTPGGDVDVFLSAWLSEVAHVQPALLQRLESVCSRSARTIGKLANGGVA